MLFCIPISQGQRTCENSAQTDDFSGRVTEAPPFFSKVESMQLIGEVALTKHKAPAPVLRAQTQPQKQAADIRPLESLGKRREGQGSFCSLENSLRQVLKRLKVEINKSCGIAQGSRSSIGDTGGGQARLELSALSYPGCLKLSPNGV